MKPLRSRGHASRKAIVPAALANVNGVSEHCPVSSGSGAHFLSIMLHGSVTRILECQLLL